VRGSGTALVSVKASDDGAARPTQFDRNGARGDD